MPGEHIHKIRVSHGTAQKIELAPLRPPELRRLKRVLDGCTLHLTARDIRRIITWAIEVSLDEMDY